MRNRREKAEEIKEKNCQKSNECIDEEDLAKMDPEKMKNQYQNEKRDGLFFCRTM